MSNLLFVYEFDCPTVEIMKNSYKVLFLDTDINYCFKKTNMIFSDDLNWCDLTVLIRPTDYTSYYIASALQKRNKKVWSFWDDDILLLPFSKSDIFNTKTRRKLFEKIIKKTNAILTSSCRIGKKYSRLTLDNQYFIVDTLVTDEELKSIPVNKDNGIVKIVYAANPDHKSMFEAIVGTTLVEVLNKYKNSISINFIGACPQYETLSQYPQVHYYPVIPFSEYRKFMVESNFDIGLSPLWDNEFCNSKYYNKFLEYSLGGIIGIYSSCEPYTQIIENNVNGLLVQNDNVAWYNAICEAIENKTLRETCLKNSISLLKNKFTKEKIIGNYISNLPQNEGSNQRHRYDSILRYGKCLAMIVRFKYLTRIAISNLKKAGFKNTFQKTKKHLFKKR